MKTNNNHVVIATSTQEVHKVESPRPDVAEVCFKYWRRKGMRVLWYYDAYLPKMRSVA